MIASHYENNYGGAASLDLPRGKLLDEQPLSSVRDVVFPNRLRHQLYVAVGDPGVIDVFSTTSMARLGTVVDRAGRIPLHYRRPATGSAPSCRCTHRAAVYEIAPP